MTQPTPWRGLLVATALPFLPGGGIDIDGYRDHVRRLIAAGCDGVVPNGSLGEYQTLTDTERATVVTTAVTEVGGDRVMPGIAAYGAHQAAEWARQARDAGCAAVMLLPPNAYRADDRSVIDHFRQVAKAGLPVVAYNNPHDTKVDLKPALLAKLYGEGLIVAVKEFSGDVRRGYQIAETVPGLDVLAGADDVFLELALAGATGWIAGYPNAFPHACAALYRAAMSHDLDTALSLYRRLHPLLRWDSKTEFVQAIKLSMALAGRPAGACRPPRQPLNPQQEAIVTAATRTALDEGLR
jgi:dihydrodipicolinate synthase/N-acetylneuraminate lyase